MGFTIYYRSTRPIESEREQAIRQAADEINHDRSWLSCEPVDFFAVADHGRLVGGSKTGVRPHPDDVAAAASEGLPDGTVQDLLSALCDISATYEVDWEFRHDHSPGPIGFIRRGKADDRLIVQIKALGDLGDAFAGMMDEFGIEMGELATIDDSQDSELDNTSADDAPPTLRLWTE